MTNYWLAQAAKELEYIQLLVYKALPPYKLSLRANARALWSGEWDEFDFYVQMLTTIRRGLTVGFNEGLALCGIRPDEISDIERLELEKQIVNENSRLDGLTDFIVKNSRANGGKLATVYNRIDQWVDAYTRVKNLAKVLACGDQKLEWTLHPAEHCSSCKKLSGKVKRASFWRKNNIYPKSWDKLNCRRGCKCTLEPTDKPLTPGPLPVLP